MTIYVDDMLMQATVPNGARKVRGRWSHLMADTPEELHAFAARLGLKRAWAQHEDDPVMLHYDVVESKRNKAIAMGAVPITWREAGRMTRERRRAQRDNTGGQRSDQGVRRKDR